MQQYVLCNGCGIQIRPPQLEENKPTSRFVKCENCGQEIFLYSAESNEFRLSSDSSESSASDLFTNPAFQLELESDDSETSDTPVPPISVPPAFLEEQTAIEPSALDWSVLAAGYTRRRPKESSSLRKILPPILGGIAAFPIATLIMWFGFGRDIGSAGPTVARVLPWIVPEKLRDLPTPFPGQESASNNAIPRRLPSIDKGKPNNSHFERSAPSQPSEQPIPVVEDNKTAVESTLPAISAGVAGPAISETIARLRLLQKNWDTTPREEQAMADMVGQYCSEIKQLSQASSELKGRSAAVWRKELDALAKGILSNPNFTTVIQLSAVGKWPGVPPALPNDFVATVVKIDAGNEPNSKDAWILQEKWRYGTVDVSIEVLPDAWPAVSPLMEGNCLLLGRLIVHEASESNSLDQVKTNLILRAHAILFP